MHKLLASLAALSLAGCSAGEDLRETPVSIHADVFEQYEPEQYPKLYETWGAVALAGEIQRLREDAAEKVALHPDCDSVMLSEVSDRSAPPQVPQVFVDCENGNRWRLTQAALARPLPAGENVYNPG